MYLLCSLYGNTGIKYAQCMKMFVALLCISLHLIYTWNENRNKISEIQNFNTGNKYSFFFPTHTYRVIQNNLNNCENFSCVWVWNLITFDKATWPNTFFMTKVLQINSLITINVIKSMYSKPVLIIKGNCFWIHNFNIIKRSKQLALHVWIYFKLLFKVQLQV
jgi:ABC-type Fe3+-siderophore transport system permease subunit